MCEISDDYMMKHIPISPFNANYFKKPKVENKTTFQIQSLMFSSHSFTGIPIHVNEEHENRQRNHLQMTKNNVTNKEIEMPSPHNLYKIDCFVCFVFISKKYQVIMT